MLEHVSSPATPSDVPLRTTWRRTAVGDSFTGRDGHRWTVQDVTHWRKAGCVVTAVRDHDGKWFATTVDPDAEVVIGFPEVELDAINLVRHLAGGTVVRRGVIA